MAPPGAASGSGSGGTQLHKMVCTRKKPTKLVNFNGYYVIIIGSFQPVCWLISILFPQLLLQSNNVYRALIIILISLLHHVVLILQVIYKVFNKRNDFIYVILVNTWLPVGQLDQLLSLKSPSSYLLIFTQRLLMRKALLYSSSAGRQCTTQHPHQQVAVGYFIPRQQHIL